MGDAAAGRGEAGEPATINDANTVPVVEAGERDDNPSSDVPTTIIKASATKSPAPASEVLRSDAGDIEATNVAMERSGADEITAQRVIMTNSGAKSIDARSAQLDRSGVVSLRSQHAVLHGGTVACVIADEARLVKTKALVVAAKAATIEEGARVLIYAGPPSLQLRPAVAAAGAAAFGAGLGLAFLLLGPVLRRIARWL